MKMTFFGEKKLNKKVLTKRINRQLEKNFFTIEEFKTLTNRQAFKVIKLIARIERISLTRKEIKDIVSFIKNEFRKTDDLQATSLLWGFVINHIEEIKQEKFELQEETSSRIFNYRFGRFDLLRM